MRRLLPAPAVTLDDDEVLATMAFPDGPAWIRAVMASTLDGAMRGPDGGSRSISTPADQRLFSLLRRQPDVLLVGAGTIRAEDYRPSQRTIAVVTRRLDLPLSLRMFADRTPEHPRSLVLTTDESAAAAPAALREAADVIGCGSGSVDLVRVRTELVRRGLRRIQCEGGPRLLSDLVADELLDELILTMTPALLGGGPAEHVVDLPPTADVARRMRPLAVLEEDGTVFWRLRST